MSPFLLLKLAHVLLAIVAIGANLTYSSWLAFAERDAQHLAFTIRGIRAIDRRIANPAYALLLVTGLAMVVVGGIPLGQAWLVAGLALYLAAALIGYFVYGPVVRAQLAALERGGPSDPEYVRRRVQSRALGVLTTAWVLAILGLMVLKPSL